ncbi:MAG: V-type ATP synthase subunit A [Magnetococcales bacterium]|nr:V-type ATP synthase subunit A [Magnetococcales bacterium]
MNAQHNPARIIAVQESFVTIRMADSNARPLMKNEMVEICPQQGSAEYPVRLKAEIMRVNGKEAHAQVFENTRGVGIGDPVVQTGQMLSVSLGPGLLGQVYDGLQNPLEELAVQYGTFLPRGAEESALDRKRSWSFVPIVQVGTRLKAGDVIGTVQEGRLAHKIMVPFDQPGEVVVTWIQQGAFTIDMAVAHLKDEKGREQTMTLSQKWPVRRPLPTHMLEKNLCKRLYPSEPLITTQRIIDTFFPIAQGGTACIPGPFGAGKTVLQHLMAKYSTADIVIVIACGERAGEVVEIITEFPKLTDPRGGGSLMDRTIIICNTSSMPVAAREASIFTGITLGEYYRQMGFNVLILADSTSRWAQAMREMSGRLEEIPGEEAFPAYLDSSIKSVYERAGIIQSRDGDIGALTLVGTVSPAGGNFDEPVTQSTLGTVKSFLGLSADRAYKRFYPAIDPLLSWSRYLEQLAPWFTKKFSGNWDKQVGALLALLQEGDRVNQMMQVTGEEGINLDDFVTFLKARLLDDAYLQQDAFDPVDASCSLARQEVVFNLIYKLVNRTYTFADKDAARHHFITVTGLFKNLNYAGEKSPDYDSLLSQLEQIAADS